MENSEIIYGPFLAEFVTASFNKKRLFIYIFTSTTITTKTTTFTTTTTKTTTTTTTTTSTTTTTTTTATITTWKNSHSNRNVTWLGYGCDFSGNDIRLSNGGIGFTNSSSGCIKSCIENIRCTHFTFNGYTGRCFLKNLVNVTRTKSNTCCGNSVICGIM